MAAGEFMFEIVCNSTGDHALAETPEQALCAVRWLIKEAARQGSTCRVVNLVTGKLVWEGRRVDR